MLVSAVPVTYFVDAHRLQVEGVGASQRVKGGSPMEK